MRYVVVETVVRTQEVEADSEMDALIESWQRKNWVSVCSIPDYEVEPVREPETN